MLNGIVAIKNQHSWGATIWMHGSLDYRGDVRAEVHFKHLSVVLNID